MKFEIDVYEMEIDGDWDTFASNFYDGAEKGKNNITYGEINRRLPVFGGWLVNHLHINNQGHSIMNMVFVSDPDHRWEIEKE